MQVVISMNSNIRTSMLMRQNRLLVQEFVLEEKAPHWLHFRAKTKLYTLIGFFAFARILGCSSSRGLTRGLAVACW